MTDNQREQLHALLMAQVSEQAPPGSTEWKIYDESVTEDIEKIEPLIDIFICDAKIHAITELKDSLLKAFEFKGENHAFSDDQRITPR
jgi:hypothetical protein